MIKESWPRGVKAEIKIFDEYVDALEGLEGFSHIIVIYFLHKVTEEQKKTLKAKPRRMVKYGLSLEELPLVGVFCLDSPHRPNPIGLTIVKLIEKRDNVLEVDELDAYDGTPVLDIKPYTPDRCKTNLQLPEWYKLILEKLKTKP